MLTPFLAGYLVADNTSISLLDIHTYLSDAEYSAMKIGYFVRKNF